MAAKVLPPQDVLRQLLEYDPETGRLTWKERGIEWFRDDTHVSAAQRMATMMLPCCMRDVVVMLAEPSHTSDLSTTSSFWCMSPLISLPMQETCGPSRRAVCGEALMS